MRQVIRVLEQGEVLALRFPEKVEHIADQRDGTEGRVEQQVDHHHQKDPPGMAAANGGDQDRDADEDRGGVADPGQEQTEDGVEAEANVGARDAEAIFHPIDDLSEPRYAARWFRRIQVHG